MKLLCENCNKYCPFATALNYKLQELVISLWNGPQIITVTTLLDLLWVRSAVCENFASTVDRRTKRRNEEKHAGAMTGRLSSIYNVGNLESLPQTAVLAVRHPTNGRTARHTERHINKLTRIAAERSGEGPTEVRSARTLSTTFCLDPRVHYIPLLSSSLFCLWRKF